jgi:hypothetical protein
MSRAGRFSARETDNHLERHDIVGSFERLGIFEVNFMLSRRNLVMRSLDLKAHILQRHADLAARAFAAIQRA